MLTEGAATPRATATYFWLRFDFSLHCLILFIFQPSFTPLYS
nr:MAG TPA: hypothetical protein [Caudoviricetes sp.]